MAVKGAINLKGLENYLENIAKAGGNVDKAAAKAVDAGADVAVDIIAEGAPRDTGNLEQHIKKSAVKQDGNFIFVEVGLLQGTDAETARYGNAQEWGYVRSGKHYPGKFYMRDGFQKSRSPIRNAEKKSLEESGTI